MKKQCTADGCKNYSVAKGLCGKHYYRVKRNNDLYLLKRVYSVEERFFQSFSKKDNGCWEWVYAIKN